MIKSIMVTNHLGESLTLEMGNPEKSGFFIKSIDGLGPVKANVITTKRATTDGSFYNSARIDQRNIVLNLGFMWKNTIEETRHRSYKYFPVKKNVTLSVVTDARVCVIDGYVESNEPDIFSKNSGCQVSIICPDPFFYDANGKQETNFSGITSNFEFPIEIVSSSIEFSIINQVQMQGIYYSGDADVGMEIEIHAIGAMTNPSIINVNTGEIISIDTTKMASLIGSGIEAGDSIYITTTKGNKSIYLYRSGSYYNILNCIGQNSTWLQLSNGDNLFAYSADTGASNLVLRIVNNTLYEGV